MPNRDRNEIIALILKACDKTSTITKIMYSTLLNFHQISEYADLLVRNKLLVRIAMKRKFVITKKGKQYLTLHDSCLLLIRNNNYSNNGSDYDEQPLKASNPALEI